jgi:hypothetical protein
MPRNDTAARTHRHAAHWAWMINDSICNDLTNVTAQQASDAMQALIAYKGADYARTFGLPSRKWIDSSDREWLAYFIASR